VQVRGKKNLVLSKGLTGPLGLFVGFGTLKDYGVDKVFELENDNTDSSQRNIVYLVHGEKAGPVQAVAGMSLLRTGTHKEIARMIFPLFAISLSSLHRPSQSI
jgi:vacuolar protein sorting-associated protein 33A